MQKVGPVDYRYRESNRRVLVESFIQDFVFATWRLRGTVGDNPKVNCLRRPMLGVIFYDRAPIRVSWMLLRILGDPILYPLVIRRERK